MSKYIKNSDIVSRTWCGQEILSGEYYLIPTLEEAKWANDSSVLSSIVDETLIVSKSNDSAGHITDYSDAVNYLKGDILDIDDQGRQIHRVAAGKAGWVYMSHPLEFETAKIGSLYSKKVDGTNRNDTTIKFYDANDAEVTDAQNEANIVKTVVLFKPAYDYELIAGALHQQANPASDLRIYVLGGIIELGGAYVKEFAGGINMKYMGADEPLKTDGRAAKYMVKDIAGVPYQANQLEITVKHEAGYQHKLMLMLEYFRA